MIAIHGAFDGTFLVWREPDSGKTGLGAILSELGPGIDPHLEPLASARGSVAVSANFRNLPRGPVRPTKRTAWLPSVNGKPVPSSPVVGDNPTGQPTIAPFSVSVAALSPKETVQFISACISKHMLSAGVMLGEDLAY